VRLGNIGFIWGELNQKYELVMYHDNGTTNHVIAFFEKHREGYDMRTVGDRFFQDKDAWIVGKYAMMFLTEAFKREEET